MLAPLVLAAALSQASGPASSCPEPPSRSGPPPCAAANVPGCLPGYRRRVDEWGRVTYVCDPSYAAGPPIQGPPPPEGPRGEAPAPAPAPPRYAPPYSSPYAPPPSYGAAAPHRGPLGVVAMAGATTRLETNRDGESAGALALELRGPVSGARLRLGLEYAPFGHVAEVAFKYDFNDRGQVRPFLAVGLGGADVDPVPGWRFEASAAIGLDLYLTRDLFLTTELKRRAFARRSDAAAYGLEFTDLHQTAFFVGIGFYL